MTDLDVFALKQALFPGMPLPLHVFEDRYLRMIRRCLEQERPFCICQIREGSEVGPPAIPYKVGTIARIRTHKQLEDGRFLVVAQGTERIRIIRLLQEQPILRARVEPFPLFGEASPAKEETLRHQFEELRELIRLFSGVTPEGEEGDLQVPDTDLPFVAAGALALSSEEQQELLEVPERDPFIDRLLPLFERRLAALKAAIGRRLS